MCYYHPHQSMGTTILENLREEVNKYATTETIHQDCLGITPLHIVACSGKHDIELYKFLVGKCPVALITKDKWSETPLAYTFFSEVPLDVLDFLLDIHRAKWGQMSFDLGETVQTLAVKNGTSLEFL
mmetsp:Transcript_14360/g.26109  ORF Transcript_14360/g.26109 Transcript_14360/m.26109 type:complete len:127 (-) Transcript_14360:657-1037(-)